MERERESRTETVIDREKKEERERGGEKKEQRFYDF